MLEKEIEKILVFGVKAKKGRAFKWISPGEVGVPDRICIFPGGRIFFVELKAQTGRLAARQKKIRRILEVLGCEYRCLYGSEDVRRFLDEV